MLYVRGAVLEVLTGGSYRGSSYGGSFFLIGAGFLLCEEEWLDVGAATTNIRTMLPGVSRVSSEVCNLRKVTNLGNLEPLDTLNYTPTYPNERT